MPFCIHNHLGAAARAHISVEGWPLLHPGEHDPGRPAMHSTIPYKGPTSLNRLSISAPRPSNFFFSQPCTPQPERVRVGGCRCQDPHQAHHHPQLVAASCRAIASSPPTPLPTRSASMLSTQRLAESHASLAASSAARQREGQQQV